jgi:tRNA threonylcarbamoyladenosine biosynthesis protein TsaE
MEQYLSDEAAMEACGKQFARLVKPPLVIYLTGQLGAGKTTWVRGLLRGLGHVGLVKSPTFTLVEEYELNIGMIYHFDLYRVRDPKELQQIGIESYFHPQAIVLIEWPEQGKGFLVPCNWQLSFKITESGRLLTLVES